MSCANLFSIPCLFNYTSIELKNNPIYLLMCTGKSKGFIIVESIKILFKKGVKCLYFSYVYKLRST